MVLTATQVSPTSGGSTSLVCSGKLRLILCFVCGREGPHPPKAFCSSTIRVILRFPPADDGSHCSHCSQEVEAGYQLLLSYGERNNDDFFVHYGELGKSNTMSGTTPIQWKAQQADGCELQYNRYPHSTSHSVHPYSFLIAKH